MGLTYPPKTLSGIDTLYFFIETNREYNTFFALIEKELQAQIQHYTNENIAFENNHIKISIDNKFFEYCGNAQGFYWFEESNNFFTVGLKHSLKNPTLKNIQIQLNAIGIYTLGIPALLEYISKLFDGYITGYMPVTRADLNIFIQTDLSHLSKEMFATKKRSYQTIAKEISSKYALQTLYIGNKPFVLRLYNKLEELEKSPKKEMMHHYFTINGLDISQPIFNVEFELHRAFLKAYKIDTVKDLLHNAKALFQECTKLIRLIDISSIPQSQLHTHNRYKAKTDPLWEYIAKSYHLESFLSTDTKLIRHKPPKKIYTYQQAIHDHCQLALKASANNISIDALFYQDVLESFREFYHEHTS